MNQLINKLIPLFVLVALFFIWQKSGVKLSPHYKAGDVPQGMCPKDKGGVKLTSSLSTTWLCDGPQGIPGMTGPTGMTGPIPLGAACTDQTADCWTHCTNQTPSLTPGFVFTDAGGTGVDLYLCGGPAGGTGPSGPTGPTGLVPTFTACPVTGNCANYCEGLGMYPGWECTTGDNCTANPIYLCAGPSGPSGSSGTGFDEGQMWTALETDGTTKNIGAKGGINFTGSKFSAYPTTGGEVFFGADGNDQGLFLGGGAGLLNTDIGLYIDKSNQVRTQAWANNVYEQYDSGNQSLIYANLYPGDRYMKGGLTMQGHAISGASTIGASGNIGGGSLETAGGQLIGLNTPAGQEVFIDWGGKANCSKGLGYINKNGGDPKCF